MASVSNGSTAGNSVQHPAVSFQPSAISELGTRGEGGQNEPGAIEVAPAWGSRCSDGIPGEESPWLRSEYDLLLSAASAGSPGR